MLGLNESLSDDFPTSALSVCRVQMQFPVHDVWYVQRITPADASEMISLHKAHIRTSIWQVHLGIRNGTESLWAVITFAIVLTLILKVKFCHYTPQLPNCFCVALITKEKLIFQSIYEIPFILQVFLAIF